VLAQLGASVIALDEDPALCAKASENLAALGHHAVIATGPLTAGWQAGAPYDAIMLEGASEVVPERLLAQLKDGGRLVGVIGSGPIGKGMMYRKAGEHISVLSLFDAAAPLLPGFAKEPAFVF
jgi:protein-L-isoaspartate(D-aspartate) O-methyltransferase